MGNSDWNMERWRIALVLFVALVGGSLTGHWLISLLIALFAYIAWLLYKLRQLHRWLLKGAKASALPDNNGIWERITQQIQSINKKSDKRKKRMSKLLKRHQGIITGLPYATIVLNDNNEIDWANDLAKEYLNLDIKTDRGQKIDNLLRLPEVHHLFAQNSSDEIEISLVQESIGPERQIALQIISVDAGLKLLIARDISERINIQKMRKNFIANASHELRTPLTVISGYLEIMQDDAQLPQNLITAVTVATEQSIRMQRIIEDLLTLSRLENSELSDNSSSIIDVPKVLNKICADEASLISNESHQIHKEIDETLKINGSEAEIISVCSNLIHNSVRHTQTGTSITVKWYKNNEGEAVLSVADDGHGIAPEHLNHLTERFYCVDKGRTRDKGGTGLGLAIVQHITQRHAAQLDISSEVGLGSKFSVCFPKTRIIT